MKIAIITAGGAGMFCGSCMQDNTLARTLRLAGEDAVLLPTYTPIRVDEENLSAEQIFLGGINVYLDSAIPGWSRLPGWATNWLNRPAVIQWLSRFAAGTDASQLGALTLDMLKGIHGPQKREVRNFVSYLCNELQPDVILFSNALLSGVLSELRPRFAGPILCLLQGDDVFLEGLSEQWKPRVLDRLRHNCADFDGFLTHSDYYRHFMAGYLNICAEKFRRIPLTIDVDGMTAGRSSDTDDATSGESRPIRRVGYFARICPEKGVHNLLRAAAEIFPDFADARLTIAGQMDDKNSSWFAQQLATAWAQLSERTEQILLPGSPDSRAEKLQIMSEFDLLCVPTDYHEPKGLYVLEAALQGVPALLPAHGAFPELVKSLGCGTLYDPADADGLTRALRTLMSEESVKARPQAHSVARHFGMSATAPAIVEAISSFR